MCSQENPKVQSQDAQPMETAVMPNDGFVGLYIHIPFCRKKCMYCDFLSTGMERFASQREAHARMTNYVRLLCGEITRYVGQKGQTVDSVFIGGGTPSLLKAVAIAHILDAVRQKFTLMDDAEISIEVNPGTLTAEKLRTYRANGINRISLGVQSLDDTVLRTVGRAHDANGAMRAFSMIRAAGFDNVNVDVMAGLPKQTEKSLHTTLQTIAAWQPEHVSFYPLILEEDTPLKWAVDAGHRVLPDENETHAMQRDGIAYLEQSGLARYEISNFARPGRICRHNHNYWRHGAYLAAGLGASGAVYVCQDGEPPMLLRTQNPTRYAAYAESMRAGHNPAAIESRVDSVEQRFECIMLGLRMMEGVSLSTFERRFGLSIANAFPTALAKHIANDLLQIEDDRLFLSDRGIELQNMVLVDFLSETTG